jgi:mono/diheme cytochrome c family protein
MHRYQKLRLLLIPVIAGLITGGCDRDRNHPGWDYFPDMFYSTAYETYAVNPNFADGKTLREPVKGTVSREMTVFPYSLADGERARAGKELSNPFKADAETLAKGKKVYDIFCLQCHGSDGNGTGHLYSSGVYPLKPRSLVGDVARNLKDGEIYYSVTLGFGSMGPHGAQIKPDDRWKLITYIREDLQKNFKGSTDPVQAK